MDKPELPVVALDVADKQRFVYEFLQRHTLALVSTVTANNRPEAAVVEFSALESLELIFDTYTVFRKYQNLQQNPYVAVVVGWDKHITVQYEGRAIELDQPELSIYRDVHLRKFPEAIAFEQYAGMKYFKIVPHMIRYTDLSEFPWKRLLLHFSDEGKSLS